MTPIKSCEALFGLSCSDRSVRMRQRSSRRSGSDLGSLWEGEYPRLKRRRRNGVGQPVPLPPSSPKEMEPFGSVASVASVGLYKRAFSSEQERGCVESPRVTAALSRARPAVIWLSLDGLTPPGNCLNCWRGRSWPDLEEGAGWRMVSHGADLQSGLLSARQDFCSSAPAIASEKSLCQVKAP